MDEREGPTGEGIEELEERKGDSVIFNFLNGDVGNKLSPAARRNSAGGLSKPASLPFGAVRCRAPANHTNTCSFHASCFFYSSTGLNSLIPLIFSLCYRYQYTGSSFSHKLSLSIAPLSSLRRTGPSDRHGQPTTSLLRCLSDLCSPDHWPDRLLA